MYKERETDNISSSRVAGVVHVGMHVSVRVRRVRRVRRERRGRQRHGRGRHFYEGHVVAHVRRVARVVAGRSRSLRVLVHPRMRHFEEEHVLVHVISDHVVINFRCNSAKKNAPLDSLHSQGFLPLFSFRSKPKRIVFPYSLFRWKIE